MYRKNWRYEEIAKCSINVALDWTPYTGHWDKIVFTRNNPESDKMAQSGKKAEMGHLC